MTNPTPDSTAMIAAFIVPDSLLGDAIAKIESRRRTWRYRLFKCRWWKEADRLLIARLKARLTE